MKLTITTFLTLDGVMQAPGGPEEDAIGGFAYGGWQGAFLDDESGEAVDALNAHASAFLLGRRTYDIFRSYWPNQTDPDNAIATAINTLPKYVPSRTLPEATWAGEHPDTARLISGDVVDAVRQLKAQPGDELQIWGSGRLVQTLLPANVIDAFRLFIYPVVLGAGRRLFADGTVPATFRVVDSKVTRNGTIIATYEPAGTPTYSTL